MANGGSGDSSGSGATSTFRPALPPKDLTRDKLLREAPRLEYAGAQRPALGGYPLLARIGKGGMGTVYYGVNPRLESDCAIKVMLLGEDGEEDPEVLRERRRRFIQEARLAAKVKSPHLVLVMDVNEEQDICYLIMEFINGKNAGEHLKALKQAGSTGLPEAQALDLCIAATEGLAAAHLEGVIHRDIKPDNIFIPNFRRAADLDFQAAKLGDLGLARSDELGSTMTVSGAFMGTLGFVAPEQARDAKSAREPADVFGMGAALYALLAGRAAFTGKTPTEKLMATLQEPHEPIRTFRPDVAEATAKLLDCCLAKDPGARYPDAQALLEALQGCRQALVYPVAQAVQPVQPDDLENAETVPLAVQARQPVPPRLVLDLGPFAKLELVRIPAGKFLMGSTETEEGRSADETEHEVTISQSFYMGKYEVTQEQYEAVVGGNPSCFKGAKNPVEMASWAEAQEFCWKASAKTHRVIQLPAEAQWEYACRAGTTTRFYSGDADSALDDVAWYYSNSDKATHPVGQKQANAWGLYDMHGNVWEWCADWYGDYPAGAATDPAGPEKGARRVLRGGSWNIMPKSCRSARRLGFPHDDRYFHLGFRVVVLGQAP